MDNNVIEGYDESIIYINLNIITTKGQTSFLEGCESCIYKENGKNIHYAGIVDKLHLLGHTKIDTTLHYAFVNQNNIKISLENI